MKLQNQSKVISKLLLTTGLSISIPTLAAVTDLTQESLWSFISEELNEGMVIYPSADNPDTFSESLYPGLTVELICSSQAGLEDATLEDAARVLRVFKSLDDWQQNQTTAQKSGAWRYNTPVNGKYSVSLNSDMPYFSCETIKGLFLNHDIKQVVFHADTADEEPGDRPYNKEGVVTYEMNWQLNIPTYSFGSPSNPSDQGPDDLALEQLTRSLIAVDYELNLVAAEDVDSDVTFRRLVFTLSDMYATFVQTPRQIFDDYNPIGGPQVSPPGVSPTGISPAS